MPEAKRPKDTLFFKWIDVHGSVGDLGPGYPINYWASEPTKLTKFLIKLGVSHFGLSRFDRWLTPTRVVFSIVIVLLSAATLATWYYTAYKLLF